MKKFLKILGGLLAAVVVLIVALVAFAFISLRPTLPETEFVLQAPEAVGQKHVIVFGATGKLGKEIVQDLVAQGDKVTAFVRATSDLTPLEPLGVEFAAGDVLELATVEAAFQTADFDAAITTIAAMGVPGLDYQGNVNVAKAAEQAGVDRVIMVSTIGAGDSYDAAPFLSRMALAEILPQKTDAEDYIKESGLAYTILRPGGLPMGIVPTGRGVLSEENTTMGFIKRPDLARLIVGVLYDDATIGKTLAAVDPELTSPFDGADPES